MHKFSYKNKIVKLLQKVLKKSLNIRDKERKRKNLNEKYKKYKKKKKQSFK